MEKINLDHTDITILDKDTSEMASVLVNMAKESPEAKLFNIEESEVEDALYWLQGAAQNPYNGDNFRHLFAVLALATDI